jgi:putative Mg2+ transporter-C (MgtC) family protein
LRDQLEAAHYPPKDIEAVEREPGEVELVAVLVGTTADPNERDGVVSRLEACAPVENASWNLRTTD